MSYVFAFEGSTVWSPANSVGEIFRFIVESFASKEGVSTGLNWEANDLADIQRDSFVLFIHNLSMRYTESNHVVWREMIAPVLAVSLVLARRCGLPGPPTDPVIEDLVQRFSGIAQ
jgi:hypothetical protein